MNMQERQSALSALRVAWFKGTITTDEMVAKTLDIAVQSMRWVNNQSTPELLESHARQLGIDVAFSFNATFPLVRS